MKKIFKLIFGLITIVVVLLVTAFASLCSDKFVRKIILPGINNISSTKIYLDKWHFRPWEPLKISGLKIIEISPKGKTNFFSEAKSITLNASLVSFLKSEPKINNIIIESPIVKIIESESILKEKKKIKKKFLKNTKSSKEKLEWFEISLPVSLENLRISNAYFRVKNNKGEIFKVKNCNFEAFNIGKKKSGLIFVEGKIRFTDAKNISIYNTPFKWNSKFIISKNILPKNFSADIIIDKMKGTINNVNIKPFSTKLDLEFFEKEKGVIEIKKCELDVLKKEKIIGNISNTGKLSLTKLVFNSFLNISINSNKLWRALASKSKMDFKKSSFEATVESSGAILSKKFHSKGFIRLNQIAPDKSILLVSHPIDIAVNFDFDADLLGKQLDLNVVEYKITQENKNVVVIKNDTPIKLNWKEKSRKLHDKAILSIKINNLLLPYLNPLLNKKEIVLNSGKLNANILCAITSVGKTISIKGNSSVVNCNAFVKKVHWKDVDANSEIAINIEDFSKFSVSKFDSKIQFNNKIAGTILSKGFCDLNGENNFSINITDLASDFFMPFINSKNEKLNGYDIDFSASTKNIKVLDKQHTVFAKLFIDKSENVKSNEMQKFEWLLDADVVNNKLKINECTVSLHPANWKTNVLNLKGALYLFPTNFQNHILLSADKFDCTSLINILFPFEDKPTGINGKKKKSKSKKKKVAIQTNKIEKEPEAFALSNYYLFFNIDINELRGREIDFAPLKIYSSLSNNFLNIITHDVKLNKGLVFAELKADLNIPGYSYEVEIDADNIPLTPSVNSVFHKAYNDISGELFADIMVSGQGITMKNLKNKLKGDCLAIIKNGKFLDFEVLEKIGKKIKFDSLRSHIFSVCELKAGIKNGFLNVKKLQLKSKTVALAVQGKIDFDEELDLNILMGLSGGAIETILSNQHYRVNFLKAIVADNFYKMPFPIKVRGTISDPKIEADFRSFMPLLLKTTGGNVVDSVSSIIDIFKKKKKKKSETKIEKKERREKRSKAIGDLLNNFLKE